MGHVDVAKVPFGQDIFPNLISVYKDIFDMEVKDEVDELLVDLGMGVFGGVVSVLREHTESINRLAIHCG